MKVLVTGGTGFLGSHLIDRLLDEPGSEVYALVRNPDKTRWLNGNRGTRIVKGDLFNVPPLPAGLDVVFHSAGLTKTFKSSEYYTVNWRGTASLLAALSDQCLAPRFVHLSSLAAGGPSSGTVPRCEGDEPNPLSSYGSSKLWAEEEVLKYKSSLHVVLLRIGAVYGPRDEDFLDYFRWISRGIIPVMGNGEKLLSLCYSGDVIEACLLAAGAASRSGEIFNIAHPEIVTWKKFGESSARILGRKARCLRIPSWAVYLAAAGSSGLSRLLRKPTALNLDKFRDMEAPGWLADVRKARDILGFEARHSLGDGLKKTLDWYLRKGLL